MSPLSHKQTDRFIREHNLLDRGDRILLAVSGGPDSVALAHLAERWAGPWELDIAWGHVHHGTRGEANDQDERFVRALARRFGRPLAIRHVRIRPFSEARARGERYRALAEMAAEHDCTTIVTAHHADDQLETLLMRLARGTGLSGLRGMLPARRIRASDGPGPRLIRPLLSVWKSELLTLLREQNLSFRQDSTNEEIRFLRNLVRHRWLPGLGERRGELAALIAETTRFCRSLEEALRVRSERWLAEHRQTYRSTQQLQLKPLRDLPPLLRAEVLRLVHQEARHRPGTFEQKHRRMTERLIGDLPAGSSIDLPGGARLWKTGRHLCWSAPSPILVAAQRVR
jgi:tRNA(Ile)-lysidine synthase